MVTVKQMRVMGSQSNKSSETPCQQRRPPVVVSLLHVGYRFHIVSGSIWDVSRGWAGEEHLGHAPLLPCSEALQGFSNTPVMPQVKCLAVPRYPQSSSRRLHRKPICGLHQQVLHKLSVLVDLISTHVHRFWRFEPFIHLVQLRPILCTQINVVNYNGINGFRFPGSPRGR